jgi:hypothetical protein
MYDHRGRVELKQSIFSSFVELSEDDDLRLEYKHAPMILISLHSDFREVFGMKSGLDPY